MKPKADISSAQRISVVGSTGSGKTYLARDLSELLNLPLYELDLIHQKFVLRSPDRVGFSGAVAELVANEQWIIDGHYRDVRYLIWERSDLVVYLDYSPTLIATRLLGRFIRKRRDKRRTSKSAALAQTARDSAPSAASATWARRIWRLVKTIRERQEYTRILAGDDFRDIKVIKLESPLATQKWLKRLEYVGKERESSIAPEGASYGFD